MLLLWPSFCTSLSIWHSFYSRVEVLPLHGGVRHDCGAGGDPSSLEHTAAVCVLRPPAARNTKAARGPTTLCLRPRSLTLPVLTAVGSAESTSSYTSNPAPSPWEAVRSQPLGSLHPDFNSRHSVFSPIFFFSSITSIRTYWPNGEERPEVKHQCSSPTFPQVSNDPLLKGSSFWILLLWEAVTLSIKILYYIFSFPLFFPIRLDIFTSRRSCAASSRTGLGTFPPRLASWTGRFAVLSPRQASLWDEKPHHTAGEKAPVACWYLLWEPQFSPREFHLHEEIFA